MAVWRPEMRSSFAVAGSGGQAGGGGGLGEGGGCEGEGGGEPASRSRRAAVVSNVLSASTGIGRAPVANNWATVALSSLIRASCTASLAVVASSSVIRASSCAASLAS
eukprot:scaffold52081_cov62-Phaeocystis_antarctica.AAC.2